MAIFTIISPPASLTISPLESYPSGRSKEKLQSRRITPGGTAIIDDLGPAIQFIALKIEAFSQTDRNNLLSFIESDANYELLMRKIKLALTGSK